MNLLFVSALLCLLGGGGFWDKGQRRSIGLSAGYTISSIIPPSPCTVGCRLVPTIRRCAGSHFGLALLKGHVFSDGTIVWCQLICSPKADNTAPTEMVGNKIRTQSCKNCRMLAEVFYFFFGITCGNCSQIQWFQLNIRRNVFKKLWQTTERCLYV